MPARAMTPLRYRRIALIALGAQILIVVTGAAVRLTGSGLGCSDWPTCEDDQVVAPLEGHAWIEFGNRLMSFVVLATVVAAVWGARRLSPARPDLVRLAWGLVGGVLTQVVLGGITVRTELSPPWVIAHFLVSMVLIAVAVVLHDRAARLASPARPVPVEGFDRARRLSAVAVALTAAVLVAGTLVTGSGPHGGDPGAERLPLLVREVTQVHGVLAMALLLVVGATTVVAWRLPDVPLRAELLLAALVGQIAVGYAQYFTGVPALLVALHVFGATLVWCAVLRLALAVRAGAVAD
ncbi:MAG: COX15/CtaA family protein, partial [Actinomycetota bacterium]